MNFNFTYGKRHEPVLIMEGEQEVETTKVAALTAEVACYPRYLGQKVLSLLLPEPLLDIKHQIDDAIARNNGIRNYQLLASAAIDESKGSMAEYQRLFLAGDYAHVAIDALRQLSKTEHGVVAERWSDDIADNCIEKALDLSSLIAFKFRMHQRSLYE